jgi:hypothetical protein
MDDDIFIWGCFHWINQKLLFSYGMGPAMLRVHELKQPVANDES